jgi:hypothetical protein
MASHWTRDVIAIWEAASLGVFGTDFFEGGKASLPTGNGPYGLVRSTSGTSPDWTQNDAGSPAWRHPSAQVLVVAQDYQTAIDFATALLEALCAGVNFTINATKYQSIKPMGEFNDMGVDERARSMISFNIIGSKGLSH